MNGGMANQEFNEKEVIELGAAARKLAMKELYIFLMYNVARKYWHSYDFGGLHTYTFKVETLRHFAPRLLAAFENDRFDVIAEVLERVDYKSFKASISACKDAFEARVEFERKLKEDKDCANV